jgi:SAM-dependent methyltransferase
VSLSIPDLRRRAYYRVFGADATLGSVLRPGWRVLDVGCSDGRGSEVLRGASGCDIHRPALIAARETTRRRSVVQTDVRALPYRGRVFDAVVALDVIEHFEKDDALRVLGEMERVSRRLVLVLTPMGFLEQPGTSEEPWQEHKCGFEPRELEALGYRVAGLGGFGRLRGDYGAFRWGPAGQLLGAVSQPVVRTRPELAFHLLGVKRIDARRRGDG